MDSIFLSLGDTTLTLDIGAQQHRLPIGIATLVKAFAQRMPNALMLENAIADVEDAVMPAGRWLPAGASLLQTTDPLLRQLIHGATADPQAPRRHARPSRTCSSLLARQAQQPGHADPQMPQTPSMQPPC